MPIVTSSQGVDLYGGSPWTPPRVPVPQSVAPKPPTKPFSPLQNAQMPTAPEPTGFDPFSSLPTNQATGHTVIPGLVGLHNHTFYTTRGRSVQLQFSAPRLYLGSGVTTIPRSPERWFDRARHTRPSAPTVGRWGKWYESSRDSSDVPRDRDESSPRRAACGRGSSARKRVAGARRQP